MSKQTIYQIYLDNQEIGTTKLEKSDAPMGVVMGKIKFIDINNPYLYFKEYCQSQKIKLTSDYEEDELIGTMVIDSLRVFKHSNSPRNRLEILGRGGNYIEGMNSDYFDIVIMGIERGLFDKEFSHHQIAYDNQWN